MLDTVNRHALLLNQETGDVRFVDNSPPKCFEPDTFEAYKAASPR